MFNVANFFDIPLLYDYLGITFASRLYGLMPDEIITALGMENDFTLEEKAELYDKIWNEKHIFY